MSSSQSTPPARDVQPADPGRGQQQPERRRIGERQPAAHGYKGDTRPEKRQKSAQRQGIAPVQPLARRRKEAEEKAGQRQDDLTLQTARMRRKTKRVTNPTPVQISQLHEHHPPVARVTDVNAPPPVHGQSPRPGELFIPRARSDENAEQPALHIDALELARTVFDDI